MSPLALLIVLAQESSEDFEGPAGAWDRVRSDDHPAYNRVTVEHDPAAAPSGARYLRLVSQGGNTAVELTPRAAWAVDPARAYRLSALARLTGTRRNTASVLLVFRDAGGGTLGAPVRSRLLSAAGGWRELSVEVPRVPPGAAAATVRLEFEGPDVRGEAGFDRITLTPGALLEVRPVGREWPVFEAGEKVEFAVTAYGVPGEAHLGLSIRTADGQVKARTEWPVPAGVPTPLELPALEAGSYRVEAVLSKGEERLASRDFPLLVPNFAWRGRGAAWVGGVFDPSVVPPRGAGELARLAALRRAVVAPDGPEALDLLRSLATQSVPIVGTGAPRAEYAEFIDAWEPPGPAVAGGADGADLLRRLVRRAASSARPEPVEVTLDAGMFEGPGYPREGFLALRAANHVLGGAAARRDLLSPPIQAVFERDGETLLALWTDGPAAACALPWGDRAELYDPRGGVRALGAEERLSVTPFPVFVGRADPERIASWVGLRFDVDTLPLRLTPSARTVRFRPPGRREEVRDLRVSIRPPAGWIAHPSEAALSWAEGSDASREITFVLPAREVPGTRGVGVEISYLEGGRRRTVCKELPVRVTAALEIATERVDVPGGSRVTLRIANGAPRPVTAVATVRRPGLPERVEFLGTLPAGGSARPLEVFADAPEAGESVEVFVEERTGERLFTRLKVPLR
jgi:hypothetical protein